VVTDAPTNGHATQDELAAIQAAYATMQQRDGTAERRAWHWQCAFWGTLGVTVLMTIGLIWLAYQRGNIKAFVQVVQVADDGRVLSRGDPVDIMDYTPEDEHWREMLTQWVMYRRWNSGEAVITKRDWAWVYAHTCGKARTVLAEEETKEKPFAPEHKPVSVHVESITRSPVPENYQVLWTERTIDPSNTAKDQLYSGTFVVGRYRPPTQAVLMQNRLGLCVAAYDLSLRP
jgi:type IV secretory pathway TrbF-like protein